MSYHIYTTEGIILKRTPFGEANVLLHILTSDLGLIIASARSARLYVSKLRPALQEYANISVSAVKGKGGWKITNAVANGSFYFDSPVYAHKVLSQIGFVLMQMIQGELPQKELFSVVKNGLQFLKEMEEDLTSEFEVLMVIRVLDKLGYVVKDENTSIFLGENWDKEVLLSTKENKIVLVGIINKALKASHL